MVTISGGADAGDRVRWTPGAANEYLLEWWKKQPNESFQKFIEIDFDHYSKDDAGIVTARGSILIHVTAYPDLPLEDGFSENPEWVLIQFDTNTVIDNKKLLKISVQGFKGDHLNPAGPTQDCSITATKDANGVIEVSGSISVSQVGILTYAGSADDLPTTLPPNGVEEWENRYYVYIGKGVADKATVSLGMPLYSYTTDPSVFAYPNDVGGVVSEYIADKLRDDGDLTGNGIGGETGDGHSILGLLSFTEPPVFENSTWNPSTADICDAITFIMSEDLYTLMHIENPAYFASQEL